MARIKWPTDPAEAEREQATLLELLVAETRLPQLEFERGLAVGTAYSDPLGRAFAVAVPFDAKGNYSQREYVATADVAFPYVPGLLAFRVGPAICSLLDGIIDRCDLLLFDGQGIAHPRGLGLAAHIGLLYDKPSIGMTRNCLFGDYTEPMREQFGVTAVTHPRTWATIGYAVRLGERCDPCFVSPGHGMDLEGSLALVRRLAGEGACFPKVLQRAHAIANAKARKAGQA